jgi:hypothetical protein
LEAEIAIFDLSLPGINTHISLPLSPPKRAVSKGKAAAGQRGQISCLAVVQDHFAGTSKELLAVGTFAGTIGIYHMGEGTYSAEERCLVGWDECSAGVTQVSSDLYPPAPSVNLTATFSLSLVFRLLSIPPLPTLSSLLPAETTRSEPTICSMSAQGSRYYTLPPKYLS